MRRGRSGAVLGPAGRLSPNRGRDAICSAMAWAPRTMIGLGALALIAGGAVLWSRYGSLVYFDMLSSAFAGCFL